MALLFRDKHPAIQGAALAECTATWLSGFRLEEDRKQIFAHHLQGIWDFLAAIDADREEEARERLH
jgi:hypothetical protein